MNRKQLYTYGLVGASILAAVLAWKYVSAKSAANASQADLSGQASDVANTLAAQEENQLIAQQLNNYSAFTNTSLGVATVPTTYNITVAPSMNGSVPAVTGSSIVGWQDTLTPVGTPVVLSSGQGTAGSLTLP